jgi:SAM-dependent methyltransferase
LSLVDPVAKEVDAEVTWTEDGEQHVARFHSETLAKAPNKVVVADDRLTADDAYHFACEGMAMLWRGDFQNARQLLNAMARRADRKPPRSPSSPGESFLFHRQAQAQRARTLGMLLIEVGVDHQVALRRAPDLAAACSEALGPLSAPCIVSLRELLGMIGAHEWRRTGVEVKALAGRIHPHYGVFAPIRSEYVDLVARLPFAEPELAFDIGTGTGVLALILARRGVKHVVATDNEPRAIACARENIERLGFSERIEVLQTDLFPAGKADLLVCNPPWLPARPSSSLERAVFDPKSRMLLGFLNGAAAHLKQDGEAWLLLSDLAERLELRSRDELLTAIDRAGLRVLDRIDTRATHKKAREGNDLLAAARAGEVTSLFRLGHKDQ